LHSFNAKNYSNYYKPEALDDYKENFSSKSEYLLLNVGQYVRIIFSDLAHIIASTCIDVVLFFFIRKQTKIKKSLQQVNTLLSLTILEPKKRKKYLKKLDKPKDRVTAMILLNGLNFLLFRFPLAILSFYGFVFKYNKEIKKHEPDLISYLICKSIRFCVSLTEVFQCLYLVSFLVQFFIFFKLDTNFRGSGSNLCHFKKFCKRSFFFNINKCLI
jgi:hypothetical protein